MTRAEKEERVARFTIEGMDVEDVELIAIESLAKGYKSLSNIQFNNLYNEYFEDEDD